jgi:biopolymer transport protein ExbD
MGVSVDTGGKGGKKAVDAEINLIPMIDLLSCCIAFLLITAVWSELARIAASQQTPGQQAQTEIPPEDQIKIMLQIHDQGYVLASTAGERNEIPKKSGKYDRDELRSQLKVVRSRDANKRDLIVQPQDGVIYSDIIEAMDVAIGEQFTEIAVSDSSGT